MSDFTEDRLTDLEYWAATDLGTDASDDICDLTAYVRKLEETIAQLRKEVAHVRKLEETIAKLEEDYAALERLGPA